MIDLIQVTWSVQGPTMIYSTWLQRDDADDADADDDDDDDDDWQKVKVTARA